MYLSKTLSDILKKQRKRFDEINVIPFIDIMLVLLVMVLTTATFINQGVIPIELPTALSDNAVAELESVLATYLDYKEVIKDVEQQIAESDIESETELIDYNKKQGDDFEKFIVQK